jgi:hypothetical protein
MVTVPLFLKTQSGARIALSQSRTIEMFSFF